MAPVSTLDQSDHPVSSIRNLGPASDESFSRAGIHTAAQLRELGPDAAYEKLLLAGSKPHFIGYYAMVMGLQGRPWNDCKGKEKEALRRRFDTIKEKVAPNVQASDPLAKIFNEIGILPQR
ncbi:TfoX/Sxy family DNA transformation protein [Aliiroseovarius lamellibrachiae]|uniref:TfoX/Sxy family DNA transformation protein n=1 Tax=Aliiroseovarius lamellibrachiae TaxID=1924933 RepID=UPI001BE00F94|nr:TfoX/Sxy family DNA transformation protein [Aliiroseovarius lamellibrachiae]MBT2131041.1 TfoX/Sxy family DNA transformation protein [Aliiroseovarius lamellibrachiae]